MQDMKTWAGIAGGALLALLSAGGILLHAQESGESAGMQSSTQPYAASRYALLNGPVLVLSQDATPVVQNALFRIDTATGQVWVLQLQIQTRNNPVIVAANFVPTSVQSAPLPANDANAFNGPILNP